MEGDMRLIPNWRQAPKMISIRCAAMIVALQSAALGLAQLWPAALDTELPLIGGTLDSYIKATSVVLGVGVIVGRLIDQGLSAFDPQTEPNWKALDSTDSPTVPMRRGGQ
jgi:hypothetical protein